MNYPIPLYRDHHALEKYPEGGHAGLWYDKFVQGWHTFLKDEEKKAGRPLSFSSYETGRGKEKKKVSPASEWVQTLSGKQVGHEAVAGFAVRQRQLVEAEGGISRVFATDWHFVTGLGNNHPVENGFAWHPTLGVPYLTGAAVKGLLRGWCEAWAEDFSEEDLLKWFGDTDQTGAMIFFDAVPTKAVTLKADIMTPHYGDWYEKGGEPRKKDGSNVPADWHDPNPIPFLVVAKGATFQFSIARRAVPEAEAIDLARVMDELQEALEWLGAGAKTAAGYGRMVEDPQEKKRREFAEKLRAEEEAELQRQEEDRQAREEQERRAREAEEERLRELGAMPEHQRLLEEMHDSLGELAPRLALDHRAYGDLRGVINTVLNAAVNWGEKEREAALQWIISVLDQYGWRHPDFSPKKRKKWEKNMRGKLEGLK